MSQRGTQRTLTKFVGSQATPAAAPSSSRGKKRSGASTQSTQPSSKKSVIYVECIVCGCQFSCHMIELHTLECLEKKERAEQQQMQLQATQIYEPAPAPTLPLPTQPRDLEAPSAAPAALLAPPPAAHAVIEGAPVGEGAFLLPKARKSEGKKEKEDTEEEEGPVKTMRSAGLMTSDEEDDPPPASLRALSDEDNTAAIKLQLDNTAAIKLQLDFASPARNETEVEEGGEAGPRRDGTPTSPGRPIAALQLGTEETVAAEGAQTAAISEPVDLSCGLPPDHGRTRLVSIGPGLGEVLCHRDAATSPHRTPLPHVSLRPWIRGLPEPSLPSTSYYRYDGPGGPQNLPSATQNLPPTSTTADAPAAAAVPRGNAFEVMKRNAARQREARWFWTLWRDAGSGELTCALRRGDPPAALRSNATWSAAVDLRGANAARIFGAELAKGSSAPLTLLTNIPDAFGGAMGPGCPGEVGLLSAQWQDELYCDTTPSSAAAAAAAGGISGLRPDDASLAILKSCLQKGIRRGLRDPVLSLTLHYLQRDAASLLRRLPVLCLEDIGIPHPWLPVINWLSAAVSKKYVLGRFFYSLVLQFVSDLAAVPLRDRLTLRDPTTTPPTLCHVDDRLPPPHVNPAAPDLIKSGLLLRMNWGGMEGDLAMMHEAAAEWTARFAGTSGVRPPVATDSGSHTTFLASLTLEGTARAALPFRDRSALPSALPSDDDRNPTAESAFWSRNADRIRCPPDSPDASGRDWYAWVVTLYGSLPPLGSVPGVDGLASILPLTRAVLHELRFGIDYHVVPGTLPKGLDRDPALVAAVQRYCEATAMEGEGFEAVLRHCVWERRSSVNFRFDLTSDSPDLPLRVWSGFGLGAPGEEAAARAALDAVYAALEDRLESAALRQVHLLFREGPGLRIVPDREAREGDRWTSRDGTGLALGAIDEPPYPQGRLPHEAQGAEARSDREAQAQAQAQRDFRATASAYQLGLRLQRAIAAAASQGIRS